MFPTASSQVFYNEAGEPLGWDTPSEFDPNEAQDREDDRDDDREHFDDDGEFCGDCSRATVWDEKMMQYRHLDEPERGCFLIRPETDNA